MQKLVSPVTETGTKMTLKDLFELFSTEKSKGKKGVFNEIYISESNSVYDPFSIWSNSWHRNRTGDTSAMALGAS